MALEKQMVSLAFEKGLNQKVSDRVLNAPELADVQNGRFEKAGEIRRRYGFTPLMSNADVSNTLDDEFLTSMSGQTSLECAKASAVYKGEKLIFDGNRVHAQRGNNSFARKGVADGVTCESLPLSNNQSVQQSGADIAYLTHATYGDWYCVVYYECDSTLQNITGSADRKTVTYSAYAQLYDAATEQCVGDRQLVTQYTIVDTTVSEGNADQRLYLHPRIQVRSSGTYFVIFYTHVHAGDSPDSVLLRYRSINVASTKNLSNFLPSSGSYATLSKYAIWDVEKVTKGSGQTERFLILFQSTNASFPWTLQERFFDTSSGALSSTGMGTLALGSTADPAIAEAYSQYNGYAYGCMVRAFKSGSDDSKDRIVLMLPFVSGGTRKTRCHILDYSNSSGTAIVALANGDANGDEALLNAGACLEPVASGDETHIRVYFTTVAYQSSGTLPNATTTRTCRLQISDGARTDFKPISFNTTIVSHPWSYESTTTKPSIYFVIAESLSGYLGSDFSAGCNYVVRDDLNEEGNTYSREHMIPVASTPAGDVSHTHFSNWFTARYTSAGGQIFHRATNFVHSPTRPITGRVGSQRIVGSSSYLGANLQTGFPSFNASLLKVEHEPKRRLPSVYHNNHLLIGGGFLMTYDGYRTMENGFLRRPQIRTVLGGTGTESTFGVAGRIEPGSYTYRAVYEYIDKAGNLHRSAPSDPVDVTTTESSGGANDGWSKVTVYNYQHSMRMFENEQVRLVLYRSLKGQVVSFRVADIRNDFDNLSSDLIDLNSDANIYDKHNPHLTHEVLYTNAEAPSENLGSITDVAVHQNRVFLSTSNHRVHVCKPTARGLSPEPYARGSFQFREVEGGSEFVRGLESNGDHLLVFTNENVFAIAGEGPAPDGSGSTLTEPRLLIAGQGAVDGTIHAVIPAGCVYQSSRGLYMIGRDTKVSYIGSNVEDLTTYRAIAAAANDSRHELYIALGEPLAGGTDYAGYSKILVYNYFFNAWSVYTHTASVMGYNSGLHIVDGVLHQARATYGQYWDGATERQSAAGSDVGFWKEDTGSYWDVSEGASPTYDKFSTIIETPSIYLNNLQGAQRVYRVMFAGDYLGDHDITVEMTVDHDASSSHSQTKTASALTTKDRYRLPVKRQKCRAMKIKHTIAPNSSSAQSNGLFKLSGLALEVGLRPTSFKLPKGDTI